MWILTLLHAEFLAGPLRSTGVTPLQRYYEPLRPPIKPRRGYLFPSLVDGTPTVHHRSNGSPRFPTCLWTPAVLSHPGEPGRCDCSLLHDRCWLHLLWQAGRSRLSVTRPNQVHLRYG
jgi:hypothetical protein